MARLDRNAPKASRLARLLTALGISSVLVLGCACAKKQAKQEMPAMPVVTDTVKTRDFPVFIRAFGSLTSIDDVDVKAQVSGQIKEVRFKDGQAVKAGDTLFVIDKAPYQAARDAAWGSLVEAKANLGYSQYLVEANKPLASSSALAKQTYDQYVYNAKANEGKVLAYKGQLDTAEINLAWCEVKAPCDGVTGKVQVDPGNIVSTASNATLVSVTSLDPIYADFTVSEKHLPKIMEAMRAAPLKVSVKPRGDTASYEGELLMIDNKVDSSTGTIGLRASLKNPARKLWPGQFIDVMLVMEILKDAIVVPFDAVQTGSVGQYVLMMRDGKADMVVVKTGQSDNEQTVILEGDLKPGEAVIKVGTMLLSPGAKVVDAKIANAAFAKQMAEMMAGKAPKKAKPEAKAEPKTKPEAKK